MANLAKLSSFMLMTLAVVNLSVQVLGGPTYVVTYEDASDRMQPGLLGQKKCTFGPSYWCHNITHAKECGAVKHCIKNVWEKQRLPEDNDDVCQVCKEMVKEARDQLLSNETQDELRQVLEGSCKLIPLKLIANECSEVMDNFIPELVDALASRMDPQVVCAVSGLCNSARIDEMLLEMKELELPKSSKSNKPLKLSPYDPVSCPRCKTFMGRAFNYLKTLSKDQIRMELMAGCGYMSSYSDSCRAAVMEDFDSIYAQIEKADSNEFCALIGICNEQTKAVAVYEPEKNDDLACDFCKQLVNYARQWLTDNTTKEDFEKIVEGLCRRCPAKKECIDFYHQYGGEIYQLILDDLDADSFCQRIGVCPGKKSALFSSSNPQIAAPVWTILKTSEETNDAVVDERPMLSLLPGEMLTGNDEKNALRESPKCTFCQYAVHEVQDYLANPDTENDVKKFVDNMCEKYLPRQLKDQCEEFVSDYGDQFIALVEQEIDPSEVCLRLRLCPRQNRIVKLKSVMGVLPTCALCQFTVGKLLDLVGKNRTKESIEAATERACEMMPNKYYTQCQTFMEEYGDRVLEMILIDGTSHEVCAALHLCLFSPAPQTNNIVIQSPLPFEKYSPSSIDLGVDENVEEDTKCVLCEYVISTLATKIKDNATEQEIKDEVDQVCDRLPKTVSGKCRKFVDIYGDLVIQYLAQEMDPSQVCTELKLCQPRIGYELTLTRCELCSVVADYLSMKLEDPKFEKVGVETAVTKFCPLLRNLKEPCVEMIEDYGPYLMNLLGEGQEKEQVCKLIDVC